MASLVPFVLIFGALVSLVNNIVFEMGSGYVRESTEVFARQASEHILSIYGTVTNQLNLIGKSLPEIVEPSQEARDTVSKMALTLMEQNLDVYSAWFAFEPGQLTHNARYYRTWAQEDGLLSEVYDITDAVLDDPAKSPWYNTPLREGIPYFDVVDDYDFLTGEGTRNVCTIVYPVISQGRAIGCVGVDMLYENMLGFMEKLQVPNERLVLLLAGSGTILYSPSHKYLNRILTEIDFAPEDKRTLERAIAGDSSIMLEMRSPFFREKSLVYLERLDVPNANDPVFLYLDQPVGPLYSSITGNVRHIAHISLAGLVLLTAGVFFATRSLVRPIRTITRNANLIASGRLDLELTSDYANTPPRHEVDELDRALRKMYEELKQNNDLRLLALDEEYKRKQAEEASEARTRFFANISHEIRTPMNAILGISEILLTDDLNAQQRKYLTDIKTSSESLLGIINDILDMSKLETGKFTLVPVHFNLAQLLGDISSVGTFLATSKGLSFQSSSRGNVPEYLYADDVRLRQILMNLISNAVKFTSKGSVTLTTIAKAAALHFEVADTGIGIRDEDIGQLFEAFKQTDEMKNRKVKGTGLGLSISMNLARAMGGTIEVGSAYGEGSKFTLSIPRTDGDPAKAARYDEELHMFSAPEAHVLIVDDNEINLDVAVGMIGFYEIVCDVADSGERTLELVKEKQYDAIFMDHMMPGMDGIETTQAIRALGGRLAEVPIIALTANAVVGTRELFLSSGMNDFVSKPIERDKLQAALLRWLPKEKIRINA